ncbi:unnamed protein product [Enterobius vermicularis]|uniref:Tubulin-specific chaperone A n=1 Tax=Enterobius vermicularis TaxID=51028 RepID=A0A0N4UY70_ENTVE|nr:unnamed protein product [Enterobius vermicularis]
MADAALLKEVNIKTGIVKRLVKELACYKKEAEKEESKLKSMKADPKADEYLVKKQAEVLQDTRQMIPNCTQRVVKALEDLKKVSFLELPS